MKLNPRSILSGAALVFFALASGGEARACSCLSERPVCEAFGGATAVFAGRVVGATEQRTETHQDGNKITYDVGLVYFAVEEAFSGARAGTRLTVDSGTGGGTCGYWFRRGERYLVYAYGDEEGRLYTNICSRTRPLSAADEDLPFLRTLPPEGTGVRLHGLVAKRPEEPGGDGREREAEGIAGITVTVKDSGGRWQEVVTGGDGRYELTGLKPGEYEVSVALPDYYYRGEYSTRKVKVYDRGCAEVSFAAIPDGRITGQVLDAEGKPVRKAEVVLISPKARGHLSMRDEVSADYIHDDPEGRFAFEQVSPGEYLLGLNVTSSPDAEEPYPPTFYPGVTDRSLATVIKVGLGQKLKDYVLRLPPRLVERRVQGIVVWPDGTPAAGAEVHLTDREHPNRIANGTTQADAQGRFTLVGYDGVSYWVLASADKFPAAPSEERQPTHAEPPSVTLTDSVSGLKLVLTSEGGLCKHYYQEKPAK